MKRHAFVSELKRRKVFRVAAVYAAGAFALLQAADLVLPRLGAPEALMTALVVLALLGAPVAIVLAWAFDLTPEGIVRTGQTEAAGTGAPVLPLLGRRTAVLVLVLLGTGVGAGWLLKPASYAAAGAAPAAAGNSLAVLPFADLSTASENLWFADGLTEEVLNRLARMQGLKVAGRTSSFHFREHDGDLRLVGSRLGVDHLLLGSVRRAGNRLRITAQLVKVADGFHLWSDSFDRELDDVFTIQDEIAQAIAAALRVELGAAAGAEGRTTPLPAYERYLEARTLIARRGDQPIARAIELLEDAVRVDPTYAPAWGALAQAHALHRYYGGDLIASLERAERAARRALELDPRLVSAHATLGNLHRDRYRWRDAEQSYRRALELNPDDIEANLQYAQMLGRVGHGARALGFLRRAAEMDPLSGLHQGFYGFYLFQDGQQVAGLLQMERARGLDPGLNIVHQAYVTMLIDAGRIDAAVAEQERIDSWILARDPRFPYARLHERLRTDRNQPAAVLEYLRPGEGHSRWSAITHWHWAVHFGHAGVALEHILAEHQDGYRVDSSWAWAPALAPIRRLPGFAQLVEELDMPAYWREHGWPESCRPGENGGVRCE